MGKPKKQQTHNDDVIESNEYSYGFYAGDITDEDNDEQKNNGRDEIPDDDDNNNE